MTRTTHGHFIQGTPFDHSPSPELSECDGPGDCAQCSQEAAAELIKIATDLQIRGQHSQKHKVKFELEHGDNPEVWPGGFSRHLTTLSCACGTQVVEHTIVDRKYADKEFMRELDRMQESAVRRMHRLHIDAATRIRGR
ncbi:hypothetical protein SEA_MOSSY_82 [Gordonia phage Mossy]|nr:hypothetical protein SEA_MOSSY_82 [Gordonia phage Mossy]